MLLVPWLAAVTLSLSDHSGAELRSIPERRSTSLDLSTSPRAALAVTSKRSSSDVSYAPRLEWADVTKERAFVLVHTGAWGYVWSSPRLRLSFTVGGSYGRVSYRNAVAASTPVGGATDTSGSATVRTAGPVAQPQAAQVLPTISVLRVGSGSAALNMSSALSRRWSLVLSLGFGAGGGLAASEKFLPFRYGPFANAGLAYQWSKHDTLSSDLNGGIDILPERDSRFQTVTLLESWKHGFGPLTQGTLGAGATFLRSRTTTASAEPDPGSADPGVAAPAPVPQQSRTVSGAGVASIWQGFKLDGGANLGVTTAATLNTNYNPVLGTVAQNLGGSVVIAWARKQVGLSLGAVGSRSLPLEDANSFKSYGASGNLTYQLSRTVSLSLAGYWNHQSLPQAALLPAIDPNRWGTSLGLTIAAPPIRL